VGGYKVRGLERFALPLTKGSNRNIWSKGQTNTLNVFGKTHPTLALMTESIQGRGLTFVRSHIAESAKTVLDEQTFLHWCDDEFLADIVATSEVQSAFRYIDVHKTSPCGDSSNPKPYLAFYPMEDLAFALSDEFQKTRSQSENLPESGIVYDLVDMDVSYLALKMKTVRASGPEDAPAKFLLTCGVRPSQAPLESAMKSFFSEQTSLLEQTPGYIRTLTCHLLYAKTIDQSRTLKDLSTTTDDTSPEPRLGLPSTNSTSNRMRV
jgi:hypothetical protein